MNHIISVRTQRAAFGFATAILMTCFSMAVLWRHFDGVFGADGAYLWSARAGMLFIGLTVFVLTGWHVYFQSELVRRYCLAAALLLSGLDVIHACNVLAMMGAEAERGRDVVRKTESAAKIAGEIARSTTDANADAARKANAQGQGRLAEQLARKGSGVDANEIIVKVLGTGTEAGKEPEGHGIFPDWYTRRYSFFVLLLAGLLAGAGAMITTDFEDRDGNGIPDWAERMHPEDLRHSHPNLYTLMVEKGLIRSAPGQFPAPVDVEGYAPGKGLRRVK